MRNVAALVESTVRTELPDEIFLTILQYWSTVQTDAMPVSMGPDEYDEANEEERNRANADSSSDSE